MNLFDIIGPVMIGPSSSHTAGAVRIGCTARKLLGEAVADADIALHGSFADTGLGHGTDRALVAGLLGMKPDDCRVPRSFSLAEGAGMHFHFSTVDLRLVHPNSARLRLTGVTGRQVEVVASSIGGGQIRVCRIDGLEASFSGEFPTLIVQNEDTPGHVTMVASVLASYGLNIGTMHLFRNRRGGKALMVIETDEEIPAPVLSDLRGVNGICAVTYLSAEDAEPDAGCGEN